MITVKKERLSSLKDRWNALVAQNSTMQPYQEWEMTQIVQKVYLPFMIAEKEFPVHFSFNENGKTIAIAPMARRFGGKYAYANFGKAPTLAVKDFIYPADMTLEKMKECLMALKEKTGSIRFYDVPEYSLLFQALERMGSKCKNHIYTTVQFRGGIRLIINHLPLICGRTSARRIIILQKTRLPMLLRS